MKNKKTEKLIDKVRLIFLFTGIALGIYYMIFDYLNKKSFENTYFLFSCIVVLCLAIVLHYKGKTQLANFFYLIPAQSFMTFLIYKSGGLNAPGVFWFGMLPVFWGWLLGRKGIVIGYLSIVFTFIYMYLFKENIPLPAHFLQEEVLFKARLENLIVFSTFVFVFIFIYTQMLIAIRENVERKNQEISTLLRILVHDISNPLVIAKGNLRTIIKEQQFDQEKLVKMEKSLTRMNNIISDVRRLFALSDGKLNLKKKTCDIHSCIQEAEDILKERIEFKKIEILRDLHKAPLESELDESIFIGQVLVNVLSNAIKFCNQGGQIYIRTREDGELNVVDIVDNGIGIPTDILEILFSEKDPTTRKGTGGEEGTGFGLPIVKRIIDQLSGEIHIYSPPVVKYQQGAHVRILLPKCP